jgi:hypothetical protein
LPPNFFPAICQDQKQRDKRPKILSVLLFAFIKGTFREIPGRFVSFCESTIRETLHSRFGGFLVLRVYLRFRLEEVAQQGNFKHFSAVYDKIRSYK